MATPVDRLLGQIVAGRYRIERRIGRGGMGSIYEVMHLKLGRSFALKTLSWELANDPEVLARFQREADIVAKLRHPNIVEIIDWDQLDDGTPCLIMEYLRGEDLSQRIRRASPLPWPVIARVGDQVLSALAVAHRAGIVHRDLKPQNIYLALDDANEERAKLLDFGVSKIRDSQSFATTDAKLIGTPAYMSPEQADGAHADVGTATDVWAMGAILHEMATGRLAFEAANMPAILYRICHKDADDVRIKRPDASPAYAELIAAALDRDPARRIREADDLRAGLRKALGGLAGVVYVDPLRSPVNTPPAASTATEIATEPTLAATPDVVASVALMPTTLGSSIGESIPRAPVSDVATPTAARRGRGVAIGLGAVVLAGVAGVAFVMTRGGGGAAKPVAVTTPDAARPPVMLDAATAAAVAPDAADTVTLTIASEPSGAQVYRRPGNALVGKTPFTMTAPKGSETIELSVERGGRQPRVVTFTTDADHEAQVTLDPIRSSTPPTHKTKPHRKKGDPVNPFEDP